MLPLIVYAITLHPGLPAGDSGELITAAWTGGIAHPPGYPLYVMLAGAWAHLLPLGSVAWRMNLFSAVCMALAAGVVALTVARLSRSHLAALIAAWAFAFAAPVWKYALVAEVFGLNALLAALALWAFARALPMPPKPPTPAPAPEASRRRTRPPRAVAARAPAAVPAVPDRAAVMAIAFLTILALSHHHTLLILGVPLAAVSYAQAWRASAGHRMALTLDVGFAKCAALLPLLWLPFASAHPHALVWGDASSVRGFLSLLLRADYGTFHLAPVQSGMQADTNHALLFAQSLPHAVGLLPLAFALVGAGVIARRHRALSTALLLYALLQALFFARVEFPSNALWLRGVVERFYILPLLVLALLAGMGAAWALDRMRGYRIAFAADAVVMLALTLSYPLVAHGRVVDQRGNMFTQTLGRGLLASLPPHAVLFTQGDLLHNALAYLQRVQGERPDVTVCDQELMTYPWYVRRLRASSPGVLPPLGVAQRIALTDGRVLEGIALHAGDSLDVLVQEGRATLSRAQIMRITAAPAESLFTSSRAAFSSEPLRERGEDRYSGQPGTRNLLWLEYLQGRRPMAFAGFKDDSYRARYTLTPVGFVGWASPFAAPPSVATQVAATLRALAAAPLDVYLRAYEPYAFEQAERWRFTAVASRAALLLCQSGVLPLPDSLETGHQRLVAFAERFEAIEPCPDPPCLRAIAFLREADPAFRDVGKARLDYERYQASGVAGAAQDAEVKAALARLGAVSH